MAQRKRVIQLVHESCEPCAAMAGSRLVKCKKRLAPQVLCYLAANAGTSLDDVLSLYFSLLTVGREKGPAALCRKAART